MNNKTLLLLTLFACSSIASEITQKEMEKVDKQVNKIAPKLAIFEKALGLCSFGGCFKQFFPGGYGDVSIASQGKLLQYYSCVRMMKTVAPQCPQKTIEKGGTGYSDGKKGCNIEPSGTVRCFEEYLHCGNEGCDWTSGEVGSTPFEYAGMKKLYSLQQSKEQKEQKENK